MLQKQAIEPRTFSLLNELMQMEVLSTFNLVGGTALALKFGHRISIDLDLFSKEEFNNENVINQLVETFKDRFVLSSAYKVGIFCFIDGIKVDLVHYSFELLFPIEIIDNVRLVSIQDISAMKTQAILGRGVKKDFYDLHELLNHFSLEQIIEFHKRKYPIQTLSISIPQAIVYFEDANESEEPISLLEISWETIKSNLQKEVNAYLR